MKGAVTYLVFQKEKQSKENIQPRVILILQNFMKKTSWLNILIKKLVSYLDF